MGKLFRIVIDWAGLPLPLIPLYRNATWNITIYTQLDGGEENKKFLDSRSKEIAQNQRNTSLGLCQSSPEASSSERGLRAGA